MKVIAGTAKGRKLESLPGLETRPTTAMMKESIANIFQFELEGARVLDLFAGTGQVGIELLSRGASFCTFVDQNRACEKIIRQNLEHTQLSANAQVVTANVLDWLRMAKGPFEIVFLDPPYLQGLTEKSLRGIIPFVAPCGGILCETAREEELPSAVENFTIKKEYRYGKRKFTLYRFSEQLTEG